MIKNLLKRLFDIRDGEVKIALIMQGYIFLIIAALLIIKPAINSLFISNVGAENLPFAYLLVALAAVVSSYAYSWAAERYPLDRIIRLTLVFSTVSLVVLGILLYAGVANTFVLYLFYSGVAIYAVLATSQFWVLANLIFNVREAKRLFGFIGSGAIAGGIFGGYLTTALVPIIGNENLMFIAAFLILLCLPLLSKIWGMKVSDLNVFKQKKRTSVSSGNPLKLILGSTHLTFLALIIGVSVITAKLVDYLFSYIAAENFTDSDALTAFFGFWLSTFNVISLLLQLFITRKIVGVWGVGYALLLLPILIFIGGVVFFFLPELWLVVMLKALDGSLKQSINRSSMELIALPLPLQLKKKTKSFVDVVVDSIATGIAGFLLIFLFKGLDVSPKYVTILITLLTALWIYFVLRLRKEYFLSFRRNLEEFSQTEKRHKKPVSQESFLEGMRRIFREGSEHDVLYMLKKALEIKDKRLENDIFQLLEHPSNKVKAQALHNLFYLNKNGIHLEVQQLLRVDDQEVVLAAMDYLLLHAEGDEGIVFDQYLDHSNPFIANASLICLAKESRDNPVLKQKYGLFKRLKQRMEDVKDPETLDSDSVELLKLIGLADYEDGYHLIHKGLKSDVPIVFTEAMIAAGNTLNSQFINPLLEKLRSREKREEAIQALFAYGKGLLPVLYDKIHSGDITGDVKTFIPRVIAMFRIQESVDLLMTSFTTAPDLSVRLECVESLAKLKETHPHLRFKQSLIAQMILEECKIYNGTINAMHTQIIVHYLRRKKLDEIDEEMRARQGLLEILDRRLESGLKGIFKLLELRYPQQDVKMAYDGIISGQQEAVTNAIEFLDMLLNPNLKGALIPLVEATILDTTSEEVIDAISKNRMSELECFRSILDGRDTKLKLAVLYLIEKTGNLKFIDLVLPFKDATDKRVAEYAGKAAKAISEGVVK